jgi:hypothetical protein
MIGIGRYKDLDILNSHNFYILGEKYGPTLDSRKIWQSSERKWWRYRTSR